MEATAAGTGEVNLDADITWLKAQPMGCLHNKKNQRLCWVHPNICVAEVKGVVHTPPPSAARVRRDRHCARSSGPPSRAQPVALTRGGGGVGHPAARLPG